VGQSITYEKNLDVKNYNDVHLKKVVSKVKHSKHVVSFQ